jgi:hypothetical protein
MQGKAGNSLRNNAEICIFIHILIGLGCFPGVVSVSLTEQLPI